MRKGMMKGKGRGYKNVVGKDPVVHSQSARGMKQPQRVNELQTRIKALSKFKSPAFQEEREMLKQEYKNLLNRDIDDFNIGIKNLTVRKRMKDIEETFTKEEFKQKLSKIEGWKDISKTFSDGSKSVEFSTKDKKLSIDKDMFNGKWNIAVTSLRNDEPPQLMADTNNTKEEAYNKAKKYMEEEGKKEKDIKYGFKNMDDNKDYLFNSKEERDKILLKGQSEGKFWNTYTFKNIDDNSMILGQ